MKSSRLKYFVSALCSVAIWGFFSIPLRTIKHYPSDEILYYRIFTSAIIISIGILIFRKAQLRHDLKILNTKSKSERNGLLGLTIIAGVLLTGNWFTFIYAVNHVNLQSAAFAYMVCPLITAFAGFFVLKEQLSRLKLISLGMACFSILLLAQGSIYDVLWSVLIAALYSFYLIIQKVTTSFDKLNLLAVHILVASVLITPFFLSSFNTIPSDNFFWITILLISVVFTIVPLFLSLYALIGMPSSTLGIIIYLNPIIAFAVAIFYFDETIDQYQIYAYSLLIIAIVVFNWAIIRELLFKNPAKGTGEQLN